MEHAQGFTAILKMPVFHTVKNLDGVTENWVKEKVIGLAFPTVKIGNIWTAKNISDD